MRFLTPPPAFSPSHSPTFSLSIFLSDSTRHDTLHGVIFRVAMSFFKPAMNDFNAIAFSFF